MVLKKIAVGGLFIVFLLVLSLGSYSAVLVNEILANGLNDPDSEWIELFNNESLDINLTNWKISETSSSNFTLNATIPANGFIVLAGDFATFNAAYPNVNSSGINVINITISNFNLADSSGEVKLYNSSGALSDSIAYVQASGKSFENVSIGRHPDGNPKMFNLTTPTPGAKNDREAPTLNKWIIPSGNNTKISALFNITVNITDDTAQVNSTLANFNGTNFSMVKDGNFWSFLLNTSQYIQKQYNVTIFFNDSYGKSGFDVLLNVTVNNSPFVVSFSPLNNITQILLENSTLNFNINASDPDDALLNFSWFIDNALNSTNPANFSYSQGFEDNGTHAINATITDAASNQVSLKWAVRVTNLNRAPILGDISNKSVSKNTNLTFNITATDSDNDALAFSSNNSAIAISKVNNSLAIVSWKPTNLDLGSNVVNFTVGDGFLIDSKVVTITVDAAGNRAPRITSSAVTSGTRDELYNYDVDATDADNDTLRFSLKTNASGMSIDSSSGLISFTPGSNGVFSVNASATDFVEIINQSYTLTIAVGNNLRIDDVDAKVDGKKSSNVRENSKIGKEAKPGSDVEFKITVKNNFVQSDNIKIEDIKVETAIEGIDDGADLEEESNEFNLNEQDDKTVTMRFKLPLNIEEGDYDVAIHAEGEDENGNAYERDYGIELEVEKEKHDLRLLRFELSPAIISCARAASGRLEVINIGQEDEENAVLDVKSDDLGLNFEQKGISIQEGTEDNIISMFANLKINENAENGDYKITANAYSDDGKLRDTKTAQLKIVDCVKTKAPTDEVVLLIGTGQKEKSSQDKNIEPVKTPIKKTIVKTTSEDAEKNMKLLLISGFVMTLFFVVVVGILVLAG